MSNDENNSDSTNSNNPIDNENPNDDNSNNNNNSQHISNDNQLKLRTVPIRNSKFELTDEEKLIKPDEYLLFSSNYPILPFVKQPGIVRPGNL